MLRIRPILFYATAVALVFPALVFAQTPASAAAHTAAARTIHLDVVVRDAEDKPVTGLTDRDFTVLDNKKPAAVVSFSEAGGETQATPVVIVIDAVNTPVSAVSYQRDQLAKFLRMNDGHLAQPTSIAIVTDTSVRFSNAATTNGNELADGLNKAEIGLRDIRRSTGFYGAEDEMNLSLNALNALVQAEAKLPGRKLMIWLSPGWPLLSGAEMELTKKQQDGIYEQVAHLSTVLREDRITLYDVNTWGADEALGRSLYYENFLKGLSKPSQAELGDMGLQVLAQHSGGLVQNSNDVDAMLRRCFADAGAHYEMALDVPAADDAGGVPAYHSLEVRVDRPGVTVRTREGYYSLP